MSALPGEGLARAERRFAATFGEMSRARRWWVPGRIELLGKHVDYGGGRSLLVAVDRGFHVVARPRTDRRVHIVDARTGSRHDGLLDAGLPPHPGHWTNYPISVLRRVARDFPGAHTGLDMVIASSLPSAAGLSSSSALVIATFLPLAAVNDLASTAAWQHAIGDADALAGYLGAVENGRAFGPFPADFGVGTQGGSQDHTAVLRCRAGAVSQFRFLPVREERRIVMPPDLAIVVASSGVAASKGGGAQARYNALSAEMQELLALWREADDPDATSLLAVLESDEGALERLAARVRAAGSAPATLEARLRQFAAECRELIPAVANALSAGDAAALGAPVARSHALAETVLRNQVPETSALVRLATSHGAVAASAFGAGFGGSVWAMVPADEAAAFSERWRAGYLAEFPARALRGEVFISRVADGAHELGG